MKFTVHQGYTCSLADLAPNSIALDGYCQGPAADPDNRRYSFDHHGVCLRHATSSTCQQVLDALLLGLDPDEYDVFINDLDADSALAAWLLRNRQRASESAVRDLVRNVGARDALGPAYPLSSPPVAYAFGQLVLAQTARSNGQFRTDHEIEMLLEGCLDQISRFLDEPAQSTLASKPGDVTFDITYQGTGWIMAKGEEGGIFQVLYRAGHTRAIVYRELADRSTAYTIGKRSEFVDHFPIALGRKSSILAALAKREAGWGGSTTVGGAPRHADGSRSRLTPADVFAIVEAVLRERNAS